jgi:hypothetical protein
MISPILMCAGGLGNRWEAIFDVRNALGGPNTLNLTSEAALTMFKLQRVFEEKNVPDSEANLKYEITIFRQ